MLTHHIQQSQLISMNLDFWKGLSKDQQDAVKKAVSEAGDYETQVALTTEKDDVDKLKGLGATIVTAPELKIDWKTWDPVRRRGRTGAIDEGTFAMLRGLEEQRFAAQSKEA